MPTRHRRFAPCARFFPIALLAALAACSGRTRELPPIVLVTFDTTRVDHLSAYGYERETTPNLDAMIASRGMRFDNMTAASNNTSCSFASVHSGAYVRSHGVIKLATFNYPLEPEFKTLGEVLGENGYFRVAAVGAAHLNGEVSGLGRGFDKYFEHPPDPNEIEKPCERTNAELLPFLEETYGGRGKRKRPLFLWLHYFDPHWPYVPPPPFDTAFPPEAGEAAPPAPAPPEGFLVDDADRDLRENRAKYVSLYDGEIRRTDAAMGEVLKSLDKLGILSKAIVVFTSDHGENLGEHDLYYNHLGIYQPVVHIPFIVSLPGSAEKRTSDALVHHVDILPTILDAAGIPEGQWPKTREGRSLLPLIRGRESRAHEVVFTEAAHYREKAVRDDRYKLIVDGSLQKLSLYDLASDPGETVNLEAEEKETAQSLLASLENFVGSRDFRFHAVAAKDAPASVPYTLRIVTRKEIGKVEPALFDAGDSAPAAAGTEQVARFTVAPGTNKGVKATVPYGALFLDAFSTATPIESTDVWLGGRKPQKDTSTPLVFRPGEENAFPEKAPSARKPIVRVEEISRDAAARYRFTLGPLAPGEGKQIILRAGTDGVLFDAKRVSGSLHYAGFDVPDRFRIASVDASEEAAFEISVRPWNASFFIEGKVDERKIANTEYRRGPPRAGEERSYPTTLFVSPNGLGAAADPATVATDFLAKPGFHLWIDLREGERTRSEAQLDPEQQRLLEALGYAGGGAGGRGVAPKKPEEKPAPDGATTSPPAPSDGPRR